MDGQGSQAPPSSTRGGPGWAGLPSASGAEGVPLPGAGGTAQSPSGAPPSLPGGLPLCPPQGAAGPVSRRGAAGQLQGLSSPPPAVHRAPDQPVLGGAPPGDSGHRGQHARPGLAGPAVLEASEGAKVSEGRAACRSVGGGPRQPPTTPSPLQGGEEPALPGADGLQPVVSTHLCPQPLSPNLDSPPVLTWALTSA